MNDIISEKLIRDSIANKSLQNINIKYYDETDSTNTRAKIYAKENPTAPTLFIADRQTLGRGRLGRSFESDGGVGIYMTLLIRAEKDTSDIVKMTAETAVKVRRAIIRSANISPKIKWVNDLYVGERKLCGILCEGIFDDNGAIRFIAIGIGVNVYSRCFSKEISDIATSIEDSGGAPISRNKIIAAIIEEMLCESDPLELLCEYRSASMLIDRYVTVLSPTQPPYISRVIGISDDYRLIVEHNGKTEFLFSGEVSLKLK